jgi:Zn-dependent alcohol dehydrogenase
MPEPLVDAQGTRVGRCDPELVAPGKPFEIEELDLDGPKENEVLVRYSYAGLCHSDLHLMTRDFPARLPMVGGHEGAGIIEEVGSGVSRVAVGSNDEEMALSQELTWGVGADKAIITCGVVKEPEVTAAFNAIRKGGTVVVTGMGSLNELTARSSSMS